MKYEQDPMNLAPRKNDLKQLLARKTKGLNRQTEKALLELLSKICIEFDVLEQA